MTREEIIAATCRWLERAVIGLDLCPFAESVYRAGRVRLSVSDARSASELLKEFRAELTALQACDPIQCETALLIHPWVLEDFVEYNDFLDVCETTIADMGLEGDLQVASFHPRYRFAGTQADDIENFTNRSPFPMLHLLRESSVGHAVASMPDTGEIYRRNILALRRLGHAGWRRLWRD